MISITYYSARQFVALRPIHTQHAAPMPCRQGFRMCLSYLIYTVRPRLIHTCHAAPMPCSDHAVLLKATAQHGRLETAVLCCGLEKNGMVRAWQV